MVSRSEPSLPRYFVRSDSPPGAGARSELAHCADSFRLFSRAASLEVVVGVDRAGELAYTTGPARANMSERALRELSVHELLCSSEKRPPARAIQAERLFLFEMEFLEQVAGPELNQPVYAYGTLIGPIVDETPAARVRGQLTLTRADLLEGFAIGREFAFRCAAEGTGAHAVYHALLPGGRAEDIAEGRDVLLAYPLAPTELAEENLENAAIVQLLVAELVEALRKDLSREERGRGLLEKWFGTSRAAQLVSPETLDFSASMELAAMALRYMPEWPSARSRALRTRIVPEDTLDGLVRSPARIGGEFTPSMHGAGNQTRAEPASAPAPQAALTSAPAPQAALPTRAARWKKPADAPPAWTRDFLPEQHRADPAASYVTWKAPRSTKKLPDSSEWMDDFRAPAQSSGAAGAREQSASENEKATRPDWMRDFDDE
jgi:hypothetical protein